MTPSNAQIPVGASQQYTAMAVFSDGTIKSLKSVTWASSNTAIATISKSGIAKAMGLGASTISASSGGLTGTTTLTTFSLSVSPMSVTISVGGTQQFTATETFANGSNANLTTVVTWKSSKTRVATIDGAGFARGVASGTTTITATDMGISAPSATLTVR